MQELVKGSTLQDGRYRIEGVLGRGGFGITYVGETEATLTGELGNMDVHVKVAIKEFFMRDRCMRDDNGMGVTLTQGSSMEQVDKYRQKFVNEARNLAGIHHPNIVNVSDVFEENNTVYYVMQYLPGGSLSQLVKQSPASRLDEESALRYVMEIGNALDYLHTEKKMCHLDVKPANILIGNKKEAILIDFGISKTFDDEGNASTSSVSYSNNYAPLEQYQAVTTFSPQTDLYSLGATFYYMLTGNTPPEASQLNEDGFPPCPYYVTPGLWQAIAKAMQPRKKDRPASVSEWLAMLSQVQGGVDDEATVVDDGGGHEQAPSAAPAPKPVKPAPKPAPAKPAPKPSAAAPKVQPKPAAKQPAETPSQSSQGGNKGLLWAVIAAVVVIAAGVAVWLFTQSGSKEEAPAPIVEIHTVEAYQKLGGLDLTLQQILDIEKSVAHDGNPTEEENLKSRIIALKHLYIEGFNPQERSAKNIQNIYFIHADELSPQQREAVQAFLKLPDGEKQQWEQQPGGVKSFSELKTAR